MIGDGASGVRWSTSTTSSTACCAAELHPAAPGAASGSPTPGRTRSTRSSTPSGERWRDEGSRSPRRQLRLPAVAGRVAERRRPRAAATGAATTSSCTCWARWTRPSPATSPPPRSELGYAPASSSTRACGAVRWCRERGDRAVSGDRRWSPVAAATSASLLVEPLRRAGHAVRVLDLHDADDRPADVEFLAGDIRDARVGPRRRARASTSCSTTSPRCRWPGTGSCSQSVNVAGTRTCCAGCEEAGVGKVVHTSSSAVFGVPAENPVRRDTPPGPARGVRPGQATRPSCSAARPSTGGST